MKLTNLRITILAAVLAAFVSSPARSQTVINGLLSVGPLSDYQPGRMFTIDGTISSYCGYAIGADFHPTNLHALANGDELWGLWVEPTIFHTNGFSGVKRGAVHIGGNLEVMKGDGGPVATSTFYMDDEGNAPLWIANQNFYRSGAQHDQPVGPGFGGSGVYISPAAKFDSWATWSKIQAFTRGNTKTANLAINPYGGHVIVGAPADPANDDGATHQVKGDQSVTGTTVTNGLIVTPHAPASSSSPGVAGTVSFDDNFVYVYTSTGWKRSPLQPF